MVNLFFNPKGSKTKFCALLPPVKRSDLPSTFSSSAPHLSLAASICPSAKPLKRQSNNDSEFECQDKNKASKYSVQPNINVSIRVVFCFSSKFPHDSMINVKIAQTHKTEYVWFDQNISVAFFQSKEVSSFYVRILIKKINIIYLKHYICIFSRATHTDCIWWISNTGPVCLLCTSTLHRFQHKSALYYGWQETPLSLFPALTCMNFPEKQQFYHISSSD